MIQSNPKRNDSKNEYDDSGIQPDPETLGPEPQEHMKGPVSSLVKKVEDAMNENDHEETEEDQ